MPMISCLPGVSKPTLYRTKRGRRGPQSTSRIRRLIKLSRRIIGDNLKSKKVPKFRVKVIFWICRKIPRKVDPRFEFNSDSILDPRINRRDDHHGHRSLSISKILYVEVIERISIPFLHPGRKEQKRSFRISQVGPTEIVWRVRCCCAKQA